MFTSRRRYIMVKVATSITTSMTRAWTRSSGRPQDRPGYASGLGSISWLACARLRYFISISNRCPALAELTGLAWPRNRGHRSRHATRSADRCADAIWGPGKPLDPRGAIWRRVAFCSAASARLRMLRIGGNYRLTDAGLEYVCQAGGLESFELDGDSEITTEGFARLSRLKSLKSLSISLILDGQADDTCLEKLQVLRLRKLDIGYGNASAGAGGLKFLNGFAELKTLILWNPTDSCFPADS